MELVQTGHSSSSWTPPLAAALGQGRAAAAAATAPSMSAAGAAASGSETQSTSMAGRPPARRPASAPLAPVEGVRWTDVRREEAGAARGVRRFVAGERTEGVGAPRIPGVPRAIMALARGSAAAGPFLLSFF